MKRRLAIVTTHPIQYNAPWFKLLAETNSVGLKVFYTWEQSQHGAKFDPGFGKKIEWDIPLLEGYDYTFVKNTSTDPGSHHFKGIVNPSLIAELREWKPDVILVIGWSFKSHLKCLRYFHKKIPVLFRGDSTLLDEQNGVKKILRRFFLKWVYHYVDYALYVGQNNKAYFLAHGLKESQLVLAPHAIDNKRFAEPDDIYHAEATSWRKELGILDDDLGVLFAGKLESKKNPFLLLELAKKCTDKRLKFIFVGNGVLEAALKSAAATDQRIRFIDFQNQQKMPVVYRLGDIFILPSNGPGETWGLAVNEAMASGSAVMLSTKVGGAVDLVKEGENGIVFNTEDIQKCISFIEGLIGNKDTLSNMKETSKHLIRDFSFAHIANVIEQFVLQS